MKKSISFLLVTAFLLASLGLTSCGNGGDDNGSAVSDISADVSEETSTEVSEPDNKEINYRTLVSVGKAYTVSFPADPIYPDLFEQQLTDGILACDEGASFLDGKLAGYTSDISVNIDLGEDGKGVYEFNIRLLAMNIYGIGLPSRVTVYFSEDGKEWSYKGSAKIDEYVDHTMCNAVYALDEPADTRYVRFRITRSAGFFFTDEVLIYANIPPKSAELNRVAEEYAADGNDYTAINNLTTGVTVDKTYSKNVAQGMAYTVSTAGIDQRAPESIEENPPKLTAGGVLSSRFDNDVWLGISAQETPFVTLDLGKVYDNLYSFRLYTLGEGIDVKYPDYIDFYASENGEDYYIIGRVYAPAACPNYTYTINLAKYIKARYIKFSFASGSGYYWIEEAQVYAGSGESFGGGTVYPELNLPVVTSPEYWNQSDDDYNTLQNLIAGRTQQISSSEYLDAAISDDTPQTSLLLTNGKYAKSTYCYSGEWFEISNTGGSRDIFYDLEKTSTVTGFKINILLQESWGIYNPEYIRIYLSDDGTDWYMVSDRYYERNDANSVAVMLEEEFEKAYSARFVRIMIKSRGFCFIDELEIWGTKAVTEQTDSIFDSGIKPVTFYTRASVDNFAGNDNTPIKATNIALVFGDQGNENTLLPYLAYLDEEGNIIDTFMDGFLYTPSGGTLTSGHTAIGDTDKADWTTFLNVVFDGKNGLDKLDEVAGTVKQALGLDDNYKVYVYIALLNVSDKVSNFGDVDGDGVSENLTTAEGRRKAVMWFLNLCTDTLNERNYQNIALDGFYWLNEAVDFYNDNSAIMTEAGEYIHEFGGNYLWIPYFNAEKFYFCNDIGFDLTCMQPNYAFKLEAGIDRFSTVVDNALKYGMCVELEVAYQSYGDIYYVSRYLEYLYYGCVYGYMENTVHIYYDDSNFFASMCYSSGMLPRLQYYYTYLFAKKALTGIPDIRSALSFECDRNTIFNGKLAEYDERTRYSIGTSPSHGSVTVNSDGTFSYYPDKGFTGTDSFTYTYNNYLGDSAECTVNITVG
ncbi:MAG: DUF4855 domain-containing protein [Eubacteriales bacterium]|nr:DUF4855 domain-containing protein [Eubacteriales bacterium]